MAGRSTHVLLLLLCVVVGAAVAQQPLESHTTPASAPGAMIPVAEVATQTTEIATLLRTVRTEVSPSPVLATIHTGLPEVSATIDLERAATSTVLQVKSALTAAVYEAVSAAGLRFPFPQRAVRVRPEAAGPQARVPLPPSAGGGRHRGKEDT
jgi:hypothetical protein